MIAPDRRALVRHVVLLLVYILLNIIYFTDWMTSSWGRHCSQTSVQITLTRLEESTSSIKLLRYIFTVVTVSIDVVINIRTLCCDSINLPHFEFFKCSFIYLYRRIFSSFSIIIRPIFYHFVILYFVMVI